jgi:DNA-binding LytR/AlgR family response regulator
MELKSENQEMPLKIRIVKGLLILKHEQLISVRCIKKSVFVDAVHSHEPILVKTTLKQLEKLVPPFLFYRCQQSVIVNTNHVWKVDYQTRELFLSQNIVVRYSRGNAQQVKNIFERHNDLPFVNKNTQSIHEQFINKKQQS